MFSRILIANRGEIALRIIRACKDLGVETVAVYSEADKDAIYLRHADYAFCIGPPPSNQSYLNVARIISAAEVTDVEAIHPGCGFLAEDPHFAEVCEESNIKFIGPRPQVMKLLGDKSQAKALAKQCRIPAVPGSDGPIENDEEAVKMAQSIGYPVIIKALAGGGGRGMRVAHNDISLANGLFLARREAEVAFKNSSVYLEKYVTNARHIEVQVLADEQGNSIHLGMRDCSLQRRHQKLIEEAPPPGLSKSLAEQITRAAIRLTRAAEYTNAGTVEFLVDRKGNFFFIEMNTRLQVEHPITEMITGVDLVEKQLRIASGEKLRLRQKDVEFHGSSLECRINAEDPDDDFKPSPGTIGLYSAPGGAGVRLDSHIYGGYRMPTQYDSLIAKLITHEPSRRRTIACMRRALDEFVIEGVKTTIPLHKGVLAHPDFQAGPIDTNWLEHYFASRA